MSGGKGRVAPAINPSEAALTVGGAPVAPVAVPPLPRVEVTASQRLYEATSQINAAKAELDKLQALYKPGDAAWHQCETIDDRLHDALTLLGQ